MVTCANDPAILHRIEVQDGKSKKPFWINVYNSDNSLGSVCSSRRKDSRFYGDTNIFIRPKAPLPYTPSTGYSNYSDISSTNGYSNDTSSVHVQSFDIPETTEGAFLSASSTNESLFLPKSDNYDVLVNESEFPVGLTPDSGWNDCDDQSDVSLEPYMSYSVICNASGSSSSTSRILSSVDSIDLDQYSFSKSDHTLMSIYSDLTIPEERNLSSNNNKVSGNQMVQPLNEEKISLSDNRLAQNHCTQPMCDAKLTDNEDKVCESECAPILNNQNTSTANEYGPSMNNQNIQFIKDDVTNNKCVQPLRNEQMQSNNQKVCHNHHDEPCGSENISSYDNSVYDHEYGQPLLKNRISSSINDERAIMKEGSHPDTVVLGNEDSEFMSTQNTKTNKNMLIVLGDVENNTHKILIESDSVIYKGSPERPLENDTEHHAGTDLVEYYFGHGFLMTGRADVSDKLIENVSLKSGNKETNLTQSDTSILESDSVFIMAENLFETATFVNEDNDFKEQNGNSISGIIPLVNSSVCHTDNTGNRPEKNYFVNSGDNTSHGNRGKSPPGKSFAKVRNVNSDFDDQSPQRSPIVNSMDHNSYNNSDNNSSRNSNAEDVTSCNDIDRRSPSRDPIVNSRNVPSGRRAEERVCMDDCVDNSTSLQRNPIPGTRHSVVNTSDIASYDNNGRSLSGNHIVSTGDFTNGRWSAEDRPYSEELDDIPEEDGSQAAGDASMVRVALHNGGDGNHTTARGGPAAFQAFNQVSYVFQTQSNTLVTNRIQIHRFASSDGVDQHEHRGPALEVEQDSDDESDENSSVDREIEDFKSEDVISDCSNTSSPRSTDLDVVSYQEGRIFEKNTSALESPEKEADKDLVQMLDYQHSISADQKLQRNSTAKGSLCTVKTIGLEESECNTYVHPSEEFVFERPEDEEQEDNLSDVIIEGDEGYNADFNNWTDTDVSSTSSEISISYTETGEGVVSHFQGWYMKNKIHLKQKKESILEEDNFFDMEVGTIEEPALVQKETQEESKNVSSKCKKNLQNKTKTKEDILKDGSLIVRGKGLLKNKTTGETWLHSCNLNSNNNIDQDSHSESHQEKNRLSVNNNNSDIKCEQMKSVPEEKEQNCMQNKTDVLKLEALESRTKVTDVVTGLSNLNVFEAKLSPAVTNHRLASTNKSLPFRAHYSSSESKAACCFNSSRSKDCGDKCDMLECQWYSDFEEDDGQSEGGDEDLSENENTSGIFTDNEEGECERKYLLTRSRAYYHLDV